MIRLLMILMLFLFSCDTDSTFTTEPDMTLMSMEQNTINPGDLPSPMIVGGTEVDPACPDCKYPFMVSLQGGWGGHYCGGSLVREDWVITAAHCVEGESASSISVKIGMHNINGTTGSETRYADQIIVHPSYSGWSLNNDYALIHLTQPSSFEPIQLVTSDSHDNEPVMSTTMGWGATSSGGGSSNVLLEVDVPIDESCGNIRNQVTSNMVCAGDSNGGEDACQGDSGGPLIMTNEDGEYELIGIVSWGYGCAEPNYPGVYSRIYPELDWFFQYIGEPMLYGDFDGDGELTEIDVEILIAFVTGLSPVSPAQEEIGDMNQDGVLNVFDVIELVKVMLDCDMCKAVMWLDNTFSDFNVRSILLDLGLIIKCKDIRRIIS